MAPKLATISDLRLRRDIAIDDEAVYASYLESAESLFELMTKRKWVFRENYTEHFFLDYENQRNAKFLYLSLYPISKVVATSLPAITIKTWRSPSKESNTDFLEYDSDFQIIENRGMIIRTTNSLWGDIVKVVVSGGYASSNSGVVVTQSPTINEPTETPKDVVEAICRQAIYMRVRTEGDRIVLQSSTSLQGQASANLTYSDKHLDAFFSQIVKSNTKRTYGGYG